MSLNKKFLRIYPVNGVTVLHLGEMEIWDGADRLDRLDRLDRPDPDHLAGPAQVDLASSVADRVDIDAALQLLPPDFRAAIVLRDLCGLDYAEIAEILDLPGGTVRSRISRGRGQLADLLAGNQTTAPRRPKERP